MCGSRPSSGWWRCVALAGLCGWLGFRAYQSQQAGRRAQPVPSGRSAGRAEPHHDRLRSTPTRTCSASWTPRRAPSTTTSRSGRSRSSKSSSRHSRSPSAPSPRRALESESDDGGAGARRRDRQDVQCRRGRTGAARLADADLGAEGRRRSQGGQRGVRVVTESKHVTKRPLEDTDHRVRFRHRYRPDRGRGRRQGGRSTETVDETDTAKPPMRRRSHAEPAKPKRQTDWSRVFAFGVLPALALLLALGAGFLKFHGQFGARKRQQQCRFACARVDAGRQGQHDRTAVVQTRHGRTATRAARDLFTGDFRDQYTSLTNDVVIPGAKQKQISAVATVPAVASVSADPRHAVVLRVRQPDRDRRAGRADRHRIQCASDTGQDR